MYLNTKESGGMIYSEVVILMYIYNEPTLPVISALQKKHKTNILHITPLAKTDIPQHTSQMPFFS
jgi:hypothetical protein